MESSKRNLEIDPDYELNETAMKRIKIKEQTGNVLGLFVPFFYYVPFMQIKSKQ